MLVLTSAVSFAAAVFFAVLAWRAHTMERQRSAARVCALMAAIEREPETPTLAPASAETACDALTMFASEPHAAPPRRAVLKVAVGMGMTAALAVGAMTVTREAGTSVSPIGGVRPSATLGSPARLELLSLSGVREQNTLVVSGLVRNTRSGGAIANVTAVVSAFDAAGALVASAHASLDVERLTPGEQSPFWVTLPDSGPVQWYRVAFRTKEGIVRHLDLRRAPNATPKAS
jgi:hypothetical protein